MKKYGDTKNAWKGSRWAIPILLLFSGMALGHEYFLLPSHYSVNKGDTVDIHLFVADGFNIEQERPYQSTKTISLGLVTADQSSSLLPQPSIECYPFLSLPIHFSGLGLVHTERDFSYISLENKKFKSYLKEDHLTGIQPDYMHKKWQKERYSRFIKTLLFSEKNVNLKDTTHKVIVGHKLEILLLDNPYIQKLGATISVQVLYLGKPLKNKTITIRSRLGGESPQKQLIQTDQLGKARFTLNQKGEWVMHLTHMVACPDPAAADWESFWASYSFGLSK